MATELENLVPEADVEIEGMRGPKGDKGDSYVLTEADKEEIAQKVDKIIDAETDKTLSISGKPADAKAAGDEINDLKADLSHIDNAINIDLTPQNGWVKGVINAINTDISARDNGATSPILYGSDAKDAKIVISDKCKVAARVYLSNTYLGAIKNNWAVNKQSGNWMFFTGEIDLDELFTNTSSDRVEISIIPTDGTIISDDTVTQYALSNISIVRSVIDNLEDRIEDLENAPTSGISTVEQYEPFLWLDGYWAIADGTYKTGSGWVCSDGYLNDDILELNAPQTYYMYLMAYTKADETYIGAWNGITFSKSYISDSGLQAINLDSFRAEYQDYKFKLSITSQSGTVITSYIIGENIMLRMNVDIASLRQNIEKNSSILNGIATPMKIKDYYENYEIATTGNSYTLYPNTGAPNMARARIKQEYIQKIPENATVLHFKLSDSIFEGTKYKVACSIFDSNYKSSGGTAFFTAPKVGKISLNSNQKYYMLYIATNTADSVDLETITNDGCIVQFDVSTDNYIEKEKVTNMAIIDLVDTVAEMNVVAAMKSNVRVVNHRGYNIIAPENTIPAFELSVKNGYIYVETDVLFTKPDATNLLGVPVLLHDATINRTARNADGTTISNAVNIADITYEQALEYDFGIYKGSQYAGTKIPTFEEFMRFCKAYCLHPFIELKNEKTYSQDEIDLILKIIKQYGMKDHVTFISYSYDALVLVKTRWDDVELGLNGSLASTLSLKTTRNRVFNLAGSSASSAFLDSLIENDVPICRWTIDTASALVNLSNSYDTILTNRLLQSQVDTALKNELLT